MLDLGTTSACAENTSFPPNCGGRNRTTSACAENTITRTFCAQPQPNYLRVRGEYIEGYTSQDGKMRTTSACAENTLNELGLL